MESKDIEIIFDGYQTFWRTHTNLSIIIVDHLQSNVLEVIAFDAEHHEEAPRIYLDGAIVVGKLDAMTKAKEEKDRNVSKRCCLEVDQLAHLITQDYKRDFILSRLQMQAGPLHRSVALDIANFSENNINTEGNRPPILWSICVAPTFTDTVKQNGELECIIGKPDSLRPATIKRAETVRAKEWEERLHQFDDLLHPADKVAPVSSEPEMHHPHPELAHLPPSPRAPPVVNHMFSPADATLEIMGHLDSRQRHHSLHHISLDSFAEAETPPPVGMVRSLDDQVVIEKTTSSKLQGDSSPGKVISADDSHTNSSKGSNIKKALLVVRKAEGQETTPVAVLESRDGEREVAEDHDISLQNDNHPNSLHTEDVGHLQPLTRKPAKHDLDREGSDGEHPPAHGESSQVNKAPHRHSSVSSTRKDSAGHTRARRPSKEMHPEDSHLHRPGSVLDSHGPHSSGNANIAPLTEDDIKATNHGKSGSKAIRHDKGNDKDKDKVFEHSLPTAPPAISPDPAGPSSGVFDTHMVMPEAAAADPNVAGARGGEKPMERAEKVEEDDNDDDDDDDPAVRQLRQRARRGSLQDILQEVIDPDATKSTTYFHHSYYDDPHHLVSPMKQLHILGKQTSTLTLGPAGVESGGVVSASGLSPTAAGHGLPNNSPADPAADVQDYLHNMHSMYNSKTPIAHAPTMRDLNQKSIRRQPSSLSPHTNP